MADAISSTPDTSHTARPWPARWPADSSGGYPYSATEASCRRPWAPGPGPDLFTEGFLNKIRKPDGVLKDKLHPMDNTCDRRPNVPVEIFHGRGDKDVDIGHAAYCADQLTRNGAARRLTDVGEYDHNGSARQALPRIIRFFDGVSLP